MCVDIRAKRFKSCWVAISLDWCAEAHASLTIHVVVDSDFSLPKWTSEAAGLSANTYNNLNWPSIHFLAKQNKCGYVPRANMHRNHNAMYCLYTYTVLYRWVLIRRSIKFLLTVFLPFEPDFSHGCLQIICYFIRWIICWPHFVHCL